MRESVHSNDAYWYRLPYPTSPNLTKALKNYVKTYGEDKKAQLTIAFPKPKMFRVRLRRSRKPR